ncbi:DUF4158 domain-containing protein [Variovorax saccharolyticus]|uniref:DUF4158 domain-containing protein n=1 Tax=Variovorax saccharolyticus TaxID=3053516 RepID=UPI00257917CA|nr:DUF4158 domain-containing protein [Variovorax sp. J22R187]MDM0022093.1 DUF4158 domain-containing protein [Variovorax sp. J22R187]
MSSYYLRFVGADRLPRTLSEFDVARFFSLLPDDAKEIRERFRADRRLGVAMQFVFLCASGRPLDRHGAAIAGVEHYNSKHHHRLSMLTVDNHRLHARRDGRSKAAGLRSVPSDDRIRISLLAVDTHGLTSVAMAIAKLQPGAVIERMKAQEMAWQVSCQDTKCAGAGDADPERNDSLSQARARPGCPLPPMPCGILLGREGA